MRHTIVLVLIVGMLGGFGALFATRSRAVHQMAAPNQPAALPTANSPAAPSAAPTPSASGATSATTNSSAAPVASAPAPDAGPLPAMDRALSIVALGWDTIAPAVLANEGIKPSEKGVFAPAGLQVRLNVSATMPAVEEALARGGGDANGADVAVVPFPSFVEAYERLRALSPEVFFVVGFSRGREALATTNQGLPTGPVKGDVKLVGTRGASATFLGLFLLDIAGVSPSNVQVFAPGAREEKDASFFAFERNEANADAAAGRKIVLTTADTPRLVPLVAIAPHGLLTKKERAMTALAKGWLEGIKKLGIDPPGGARQIAAIEGAPEPLALMRRLGEMETATLNDNARLVGLSGRSALTLPVMFQRTWQLYRGVSFVSTPPPDAPPITTSVVTALVRANDLAGAKETRATKTEFSEGKNALVVYHQEKLDEEALVNTIGLLAAVFERSVLRVSLTTGAAVDTAKTKKVIESAEGRFAVEPGRLVVAAKPKGKGASIEVMALP